MTIWKLRFRNVNIFKVTEPVSHVSGLVNLSYHSLFPLLQPLLTPKFYYHSISIV